ncbi:MAG: cytochrome B5, partial [Fervidobacterium pennivorans]
MSKYRLIFVLLSIAIFTGFLFAGHLDKFFDIQKFKGEYKIISSETLQKTSGWVSVEGVVYNLGTSAPAKKFVTLSEVDS